MGGISGFRGLQGDINTSRPPPSSAFLGGMERAVHGTSVFLQGGIFS